MPRTPKTPKLQSSGDVKPYIRSSVSPSPPSSDSPADIKASPRKPKDTKNRAWSNEELVRLFETVANAGVGRKTWEGAVEGRTPNQCYQAWIGTVAPFLKKALANKATKREKSE